MEFKSFRWRMKDSKRQVLREFLQELFIERSVVLENQKAAEAMLSGIMSNYENGDRKFANVDEFVAYFDTDNNSDNTGPTFSGVYPETVRNVCLDWYNYTLKLLEIEDKISALNFCIEHLDEIKNPN